MPDRVIDLASPGRDAAALVAAARSVGAVGIGGYLRGWPQWTPAMAHGILDAGMGFLPIELYGGQSPEDTLRLLRAWGLPPCPVVLDVERGTWPPDAWQLAWQRDIDGAGWESVGYSQAAASVPYRRRWRAQYTWPGQRDQRSIDPVQAPPAGGAVQYAHAIQVGPFEVDVSSFDFPIGGAMSIDPAKIDHIRDSGDAVWDFLMYGSHGGGPPTLLAQINEKLDQLQTAVQAGPAIDVDALATALAPHLQQVDEAKLEADLAAALPGPLAAGVLAAVRKALGGA